MDGVRVVANVLHFDLLILEGGLVSAMLEGENQFWF